jgi:hypothetical protein
MKMTLNISKEVFEPFTWLRKEVGEAIVGIICDEFNDLLRHAPQWSGNYVANMAITAGIRQGSKQLSSSEMFPIPSTVQEALEAGTQGPINVALEQNKNMVANFSKAIGKGMGWIPASLTIYNKLRYAEYVEDMPESRLRAPNKIGYRAIQTAESNITAKVAESIEYGSPEFYRLRAAYRSFGS